MNKRGMEMWKLVVMILAMIFLLFILAWYANLDKTITELLTKLGERFW